MVPFVGHNAILRWSALQQVVYTDEDGYEKFWSESHVSEDFDMALRLQCLNYSIRFGTYTGEGFKEGVSLTVYDELARWEKYAYGCNELLFNPIRQWLFRGPFTPLFRRFITSNMRVTSKITILSYIGTYYAIGAAWVMTVANFFIIGFMEGTPYLSKYYLNSFRIWFSLICVFNALGNVSLAIYRYRVGSSGLVQGCGFPLQRPKLSSRLTSSSDHELQVASTPFHLSRGSLIARQSGAAQPHVLNQHDLGGDGQGTRLEHDLCQGVETLSQKVSGNIHLLLRHHRYDDCLWLRSATAVADRRLHGVPALGGAGRQSFLPSHRAESESYAAEVVTPLGRRLTNLFEKGLPAREAVSEK